MPPDRRRRHPPQSETRAARTPGLVSAAGTPTAEDRESSVDKKALYRCRAEVKRLMEERGLSQRKVAEETQLHKRMLVHNYLHQKLNLKTIDPDLRAFSKDKTGFYAHFPSTHRSTARRLLTDA